MRREWIVGTNERQEQKDLLSDHNDIKKNNSSEDFLKLNLFWQLEVEIWSGGKKTLRSWVELPIWTAGWSAVLWGKILQISSFFLCYNLDNFSILEGLKKTMISMLNRRKADKSVPGRETRLFENSFNFRRKGEYSNIWPIIPYIFRSRYWPSKTKKQITYLVDFCYHYAVTMALSEHDGAPPSPNRAKEYPRYSPKLQSCRSAEASFTKPIIMQGFRYRPELQEGLPEELTKELKKYEDWFWLDASKLKMISDHFAKELEKGLTIEGGSVVSIHCPMIWVSSRCWLESRLELKPMNVTWIMKYPTGQEQGRILTVDLGGTNIRVCDVCLSAGKGDFEQRQRKYKLPEEVKTTTKEALWGFMADQIKSFLSENRSDLSTENPLPMAFTFSFPVEQKSIRSGILQHWTKNFNVSGVVGHDVVPQLEEELAKKVSSR